MKIVIDARMIEMSGIGRYLRTLLPVLLDIKEVRVTLLGSLKELDRYKSDYVEIKEIRSKIYNPLEHVELALKIPECYVFFSPHFITPLFPVRAKKRITTIHDLFHLSEYSEFGFLKEKYLHFLFRNAVRKTDRIVNVSASTENHLWSLFPESKGKTTVIYNGIDRDLFSESNLNRPDTSPYILFVGNIKKHKNLHRLVQIFSEPELSGLKLIIVGDRDNFRNGIKDFDNLTDRNNNIFFTGKVSDNELIAYYAYAGFLVFPSLFEGFGYPPLEALSCNTPVIGSDIPVLREICGDSMFYFNPLDSEDMKKRILEFASDPDLQKRCLASKEKYLQRCTIENFREQHVALFTEW
ncbi:MAG: glycosyltransferase family 4 protein [Spirochaetales bacterium]|nr:glycosyltransferase family 4 protein [Spirochaetales bacterium]